MDVDEARHRGIHRGARDPSHGAERAARQQHGPVIVTGATGGVGSLAINMLAGRGYEVVAVSGKPEADAYLHEIGASQILRRQSKSTSARNRWKPRSCGPGADRQRRRRSCSPGSRAPWVTCAATSQASDWLPAHELQHHGDAVHPARREPARDQLRRRRHARLRLTVWHRLATDLRPAQARPHLHGKHVTFAELPAQFDDYIKGRVIGRTVVRIAKHT